jgi:hypothetical protein
MASLDDIVTTAKNIVTALNGVNQTFSKFLGNQTSTLITTDTLVITGSGRLASFWVTDAGSADGAIYNSTSVANPAASSQIATIPQTVGYQAVGVNFTNGLVVQVGTGQELTVTYYLG